MNNHNCKIHHTLFLILNQTNEKRTSLRINYIKHTIEGIEKNPREYEFHFDGDIFAVVDVFQTYRCVHIRHYRDDTYPMDGVYYHQNHYEDLAKLLEKTRSEPKHLEIFR